ncbi:dipeptide/oligopeptide/nickel ABC transporter ATP-binding protein [Conexibacter sp. JD483]|uniref:ATP-binding cassette domain-containing protein n=1 Tax=unclassified Conexibacter TaxID=2627773 RepID=UPI00271DFFAA|nr:MULTISPECIES: dipeptide/oligopeptide/nickel ABC transporter ATP-binding protein [unclassified Conexibacter]MDO8186505.1 dipeptide/oligopeptide/nickel ABC transporter ATP-binding protein [Conexibacter sp. CPCC 205706]MDO8200074.1 dipeptide/oligopeptide/nickel ABC transporter ATP-binding protein [Conexibacter sp. CPCC 205762]MDR9372205.1 dipeptide/oligopeptide/nickel ABC transporter ATP-binding protein [Conexibacter sp. JD483]
MAEALVEVRDLVKRHRGAARPVVDGLSLTVARGETVGLVGDSGCGKSTTAKLILRLLERDGGELRFDGANLGAARGRELRALRRRIGLVPQHPQSSLNPRRSAGDAIAFNLRAHGVPRRELDGRVAAALELVGLPAAFARRRPHELSGGQVQRIAIARALATAPALMICDEPVSALDKSVQAQVLNLLADLQRDSGVALLFVSHDPAVVEHFCDRVLPMERGRIVTPTTTGATR